MRSVSVATSLGCLLLVFCLAIPSTLHGQRIKTSAPFCGQVVDSKGHGWAGAIVEVSSKVKRDNLVQLAFLTDDDGKFWDDHLSFGTYRLRVIVEGTEEFNSEFEMGWKANTPECPIHVLIYEIGLDGKLKPGELSLATTETPVPTKAFHVYKGQTISGVLRDPSGAVIPDLRLELKSPSGVKNITTSSNGYYDFGELQPGDYKLRIMKDYPVWLPPEIVCNPDGCLVGEVLNANPHCCPEIVN